MGGIGGVGETGGGPDGRDRRGVHAGEAGRGVGPSVLRTARSLVALPFDAERLAARGPEMVLAEGVVTRAAVGSAVQLLEFSAAGDTVAYRLAGREETVVVRDWAAARG